ncbi:hypothetical protein H0H87_009077 [Tephrocybe sp. NHM501043]|nr:hypothetical protein H0H87_009077 [Tephrocybe sp. NHM501043]
MRGDYLFYEEKVETTQEERDAKAARRARRASDPNAVLPLPTRRKDRPSKPNGLTKQTYSVSVHLPGSSETRKWHLVAYFSGNDYNRLPIVENYEYLRSIQVPSAIFMNSKLHTSRVEYDRSSHFSDESDNIGSDNIEEKISPITRSLYTLSASRRSPPTSPFGGPYTPAVPPMLSQHGPTPRFPDPSLRLPPIISNGWPSSLPPHGGMGRSVYSSEDRRVLDSFRVIL